LFCGLRAALRAIFKLGRVLASIARGQREKSSAALSSVAAAILLAGAKLVVAITTGSLGLLSEALHSAMDLVGTALSYAAIRVSNRPPDATHPYGHAKFESLAALFAVFLLSLTALGIIREAIERVLTSRHVPIPDVWAFAVLIGSIIIDLSRSRYLRRVAARYGSQALEADAAHFATDLYGSLAVLLGITLLVFGQAAGWPTSLLAALDAGAGALVALLILGVAFRLALRTVDALTDKVPPTLVERVMHAAGQTSGLAGGTPLARVRYVGDQAYADVSVEVPRGVSLERSNEIAKRVVENVQNVIPRADVIVHTVPVVHDRESEVQRAVLSATRLGLGVHHVRAFWTESGLRLDMHMEVPSTMSLRTAHEEADLLEAELQSELEVAEAHVHIEPRHEEAEALERVPDGSVERLVRQATANFDGIHDIEVLSSARGAVVKLHCYLPGEMPVAEAHAITAEIERVIRDTVPRVYRITVHPEPIE
jgi:cation diffusion facilitator family transporter